MKLTNKQLDEIERSCLAPDQIAEAIKRTRSLQRKPMYRYWVDYDMVDAIKQVFVGQPDLISEMKLSMKDKNCTRIAYDEKIWFENLEDYFLSSLSSSEEARLDNNINFQVALTILDEMIGDVILDPVFPKTEDDYLNMIGNKKGSAGLIGRGSKEANVSKTFKAMKEMQHLIFETDVDVNDLWFPYLAGHKCDFGGFDVDGKYIAELLKLKMRILQIQDSVSNGLDLICLRPFQDHLDKHWYNYAGGAEPDVLRNRIKDSSFRKHWVGVDFSKFDSSIPALLISRCIDLIAKRFPDLNPRYFDWMKNCYINTRLMLPGGQVAVTDHGISSGAQGTSIIDSMAQALVLLTYLASRKYKGSFEEKRSYVKYELSPMRAGHTGYLTCFFLGDDGLYFTRSKIDLNSFESYVAKVFKMKINATKCETEDTRKYPTFLKREWRDRGEWRSPLDMVVTLIHPRQVREYDGYTPWHILYGIYLTFKYSFPSYIDDYFFLQRMLENGGLAGLKRLNPNDLPGSLRILGNKANIVLYKRAKTMLESA